MTLILKVMHDGRPSGPGGQGPHSLYGDITSLSFNEHPDGSKWALLYQREPIKTALVPGFSEYERRVVLSGMAYVLNDSGKTISTFDGAPADDVSEPRVA